MIRKIRFHDIESVVPAQAGIYEIHTFTGIPLKVGISMNLRKRLIQHRASRQNALKVKADGHRSDPKDVQSKSSILAKHLYYDASLVSDYDLQSEAGRRTFLEQKCYFVFELTGNRGKARDLEKMRERELQFRYVGEVSKR